MKTLTSQARRLIRAASMISTLALACGLSACGSYPAQNYGYAPSYYNGQSQLAQQQQRGAIASQYGYYNNAPVYANNGYSNGYYGQQRTSQLALQQQRQQTQYGYYNNNSQPYYNQQYAQPRVSQLAQEQQRYSTQRQNGCGNSLNAGTLIGGAGGALLGSAIGRGKGQLAAVAAGALLGGAMGTQAGNSVNCQ